MANSSGWIRQAAAIPLHDGRVCLVTSSSGNRWVIPKGHLEPGKTAGEIALQEAWEEAGLVGCLQPEPVGSYLYEKFGQVYHVTVFSMHVTEIANHWPEKQARRRSWMESSTAMARVHAKGLRALIRAVTTIQQELAQL
jgi:8-oxo-dGTP pyrophosphatase MutT (NUDIX family)